MKRRWEDRAPGPEQIDELIDGSHERADWRNFVGSSTGGFTLDKFLSAAGKVAMKERIGRTIMGECATPIQKAAKVPHDARHTFSRQQVQAFA